MTSGASEHGASDVARPGRWDHHRAGLQPPSMTEWWHGGPWIDGAVVLPPVVTGAEPLDAGPAIPPRLLAAYLARGARDHGKVYLTSSSDDAGLYAALWPDPWLYLVTPSGDVEPDPDLAHHRLFQRVRCSSAAIVHRQRLPPWLVDEARRVLLDNPMVRRAPGSQRWSPSTADWNRLRPPMLGDLIDSCA